MRISVFNSKELQGVIVAMKSFDRDLAKQIRQETKQMIDPVWRKAVADRASTIPESKVLGQTARVAISDQNVTLRSAAVGRALSGGAKPSAIFAGIEFGANNADRSTFKSRSRSGTSYTTTRHTQRQFKPRKKTGYVVMPAAAEVIPRLASLWVQTVVRSFYEQIEKK